MENLERQRALEERTKNFAIRVLKMFKTLPRSPDAQVVGRQLLRSATSVAANYRSLNCSRSDKEFASKMNIVLEEADESKFWLELLAGGGIVRPSKLQELNSECVEFVAIFSAALRTTRQRMNQQRNRKIAKS